MKRQPFSVLMSVYIKENPDFFDLSLNSILHNQTVSPDELILICDGPLNEQLDAVINKYLLEYPEILKVHRLEENKGLGMALNIGLTKCSHELIARADSDDICASNRFEIQLAYFEEHPEVHIVGSNISEFKNNVDEKHQRIKKMPLTHKKIYKYTKFRSPLNHMTVMFKKSAILSVGSYQPLLLLEDYYLWARLICNGYVFANINKVLVYARVGNGRIERRSSSSLECYKKINEYMYEHKFISKSQMKMNLFIRKCFMISPKWIKKLFYKVTRRKNNSQ